MSTEYSPFLGVGLLLDDYKDVVEFLNHYSLLEKLDPNKDDLEFIAQECDIHIEYFGMDDVFFVGYQIESDDIWDLANELQLWGARFQARFESHEPELVHLVDTF